MNENYIFKVVLSMMLCLGMNVAFAQSQLSGTVTDENAQPLPGVSVIFKGTTTGTTTDFDGNYTLTVPSGAEVVVFSYIGYLTKEMEIGNQTSINLQMELDVETLSEVVVVGYGTQDEKEITSSVTSVKAEGFNGGNVNNPTQLIQGKVAGLVIAKAGANPSQGFNLRLRGLSTVGANTEPLIVIDGVIGADINNVDPNDIASMDILKDGSAAAIYGTRGSSGVILITTKSGKKGRVTVDYNLTTTVESTARVVDVLDANGFRDLNNQLGNIDFDRGSETDWFDELTQDAFSQIHNLSLGGGTDKTTYRVSGNLRKGDGVAINTDYTQINGRLNLTQKALNDKATFTVNLATTERTDNKILDDAFRYATIYNPTAPVRSDDPEFAQYDGFYEEVRFDFYNPVAIAEQFQWEEKKKTLNASIKAEYEFFEGFRGAVFYSRQTENLLVGQSVDQNNLFGSAQLALNRGAAVRSTEEKFNQLFESTFNYDKTAGNLDMAFLAGYSYQEFLNEGFGAVNQDFLTDAFGFDNLGAGLHLDNGLAGMFSFKNSNKLIAGFARANFTYDNTYFLSASFRYEGSSRFGEDNKYGGFPAVSGGVNLTNLVEIPTVDNLKLRAGFGVTGNQPAESYISLPRFQPGGTFFFNGAFVPSFGPQNNPNPNLRWETKAEFNIGTDFSLLDGKLTGSMDYYTRSTEDLIIPVNVPSPPNIAPTTILNVGELKNNGFELALSYVAVDKADFTWEVGGNFSTFNTELASLSTDEFDFGGTQERSGLGSPGQNGTNLILVEEGKEVGQIFGPIFESIGEDGEWVFRDVNGDGTFNNDDRAVIGNGLPSFTFGLNNTFRYKNFDLNFFLRGAMGHDLVNTFRAFYESPEAISQYNVLASTSDVINSTANARFSSLHVEDASFVKLDNFTLGYNFTLPENGPIRKLRLFVSGQNLFVITDYKGVDPEVRFADGQNAGGFNAPANDGDPLSPGIDRRNTWFLARSFSFGANVSF